MKKIPIIAILALVVMLTSCNGNNITGAFTKDECSSLKGSTNVDNCYFETAIADKDIALCDKITMEPLKDVCISEIGISSNDIEVCKELDELVQGSCYANIAINNNDESICKLIGADYWWNICHYEVGLAKNDEDICFEMYDEDKAAECFTAIALAKEDPFSCTWILSPKTERWCYRKVAVLTGNASICKRIEDRVWRDGNCIKKVAQEMDDPSICEMISIVNIKQDCLNKFS